jgi:hypothetical protein
MNNEGVVMKTNEVMACIMSLENSIERYTEALNRVALKANRLEPSKQLHRAQSSATDLRDEQRVSCILFKGVLIAWSIFFFTFSANKVSSTVCNVSNFVLTPWLHKYGFCHFYARKGLMPLIWRERSTAESPMMSFYRLASQPRWQAGLSF